MDLESRVANIYLEWIWNHVFVTLKLIKKYLCIFLLHYLFNARFGHRITELVAIKGTLWQYSSSIQYGNTISMKLSTPLACEWLDGSHIDFAIQRDFRATKTVGRPTLTPYNLHTIAFLTKLAYCY